MTDHRRDSDDSSSLRSRFREKGHDLDESIQEREDAALRDYEDRRARLEQDLTGELPSDSPEPR